jgi:glycosyltransferase involved in cell wall biosynthesis
VHVLRLMTRGPCLLQIIHVIATSVHDSMGVTTALREIVAAQAEEGMDVCLVVNGGWPGDVDPRVRLVTCEARALPGQLASLAGDCAVVHSHVPWRLPALAPLLMRRKARAFVHSPHGSFAAPALAVHRARKRAAWMLLFGHAIRCNDLFIVNSAAEQGEVEAMGLRRPVVRVPHPMTMPEPALSRSGEGRTVAFLGRIHPIKGVLELVQSWRLLGELTAGWSLHIAGPAEDPAYAAEVRAAAAGCTSIAFVPALFGDDRWRFLADADVVAVPSRSENFCYVVAEALALQTPVLTTLGVPWPEIETLSLGWRGPGTPDGLATMLTRAIAADAGERKAMGTRGRAHVAAEFSPQSVAQRYGSAYAYAQALAQ